jgi:hypothetical protein
MPHPTHRLDRRQLLESDADRFFAARNPGTKPLQHLMTRLMVIKAC